LEAVTDRLVYVTFRIVAAIVGVLPLPLVYVIGRVVGWIAGVCLRPYRKLALANLRIAFGGEKSEAELRAIRREHFARLGGNFLSNMRLATVPYEKLRARVEADNFEAFARVPPGRGVVCVVTHLGNWELSAQLARELPTENRATVYQRLSNRYLDEYLLRVRERQGVVGFDRKAGFGAVVKALRGGAWLGILVDQHAGDVGVWTPFFGRLASTSTLAAMLALRTGAVLMPMVVYNGGLARWRFAISDPIMVDGEDEGSLTARINGVVEKLIRAAPEDWFWVHNRWKTPRPQFLLRHYKRGIVLGDVPADKLKPFSIVVRSSNWLGDAVMSVPAVRAIKHGRPDARVAVLTKSKLADFWRTVPDVDEVIEIGRGDTIFHVAGKLRGRFEAAVLFPNSTRSALEVWLAGVPRRVGFAAPWRDRLLNQVLREKKKTKRPPMHDADRAMQLAEWIGADPRDGAAPAALTATARGAAAIVGICPGAEYGPTKRWPPERFIEAARLAGAEADMRFRIFGTSGDRAIAEEIAAALGPCCENLAGKTTLAELISNLRECSVLLTNDTGTMHLASHLGVPTVSIFGSTEPALTGPRGARDVVLRHHVPCSPCFLRECPIDFRCMHAVTAAQAAEAVLNLLRGGADGSIPRRQTANTPP
jgi:heptosyltransferase-2